MKTPVLDHVIITEYSYYSFKSSGLLEALENSNKYIPPYELERQYHEEGEEQVKQEKLTILKQMPKEGLEPKLISKNNRGELTTNRTNKDHGEVIKTIICSSCD
jgi:epoxyqueuosine reductase QueG